MNSVEVVLEMHEVMSGAMIGVMRQMENIKQDLKHKHGYTANNNWQLHIDGALAEQALAKHQNIYYSKGVLRGNDVGEFEVRSTRHQNGSLIIHKDDKRDSFYYLLTGTENKWRIHGGMFARDAMQERYWSDPTGKNRPAYFVPQKDLVWHHEAS